MKSEVEHKGAKGPCSSTTKDELLNSRHMKACDASNVKFNKQHDCFPSIKLKAPFNLYYTESNLYI